MKLEQLKEEISKLSFEDTYTLFYFINKQRAERLEQRESQLKDIPDYGDKYSLKEFKSMTKSGMILDDDGSGYYATDTQMSRVDCFDTKPDWATHVIWFNK